MSPLTWPEFCLEPRHAMQIIGMDILLEGRGRAKSALILFKRLRVREMGGTSNGPKIRNKISATFTQKTVVVGSIFLLSEFVVRTPDESKV